MGIHEFQLFFTTPIDFSQMLLLRPLNGCRNAGQGDTLSNSTSA